MILKIIAGLLGGVVGGMGMGGGTLTIPILTLVLKFNQLQAQGINLIAFLPMSLIALIIHSKNHLVEYKKTWGLAVVGCLFAIAGAVLANFMKNVILKKIFAVFLILLGIWQLVELIIQCKKEKKEKNKKQ